MDEKLKNTFLNQLRTFSNDLNIIINDNKINKTLISDRIKYYKELQKFVDQKCEVEIKNLFNKIDNFDFALISKYNLYLILRYVIVGLFFFFLAKKTHDKIISYFKDMKNIVDNTVMYYQH